MKTVSYENLYIRDPKTGKITPFMAIRGESAYDIAVRLGTFTGTEEEWNNYIKTERNAALAAIDAKLRAALEIIPDDLEELHAQIDSLGRIQISSAEPSDPSVDLWVDTDDDEEIVVVTADDIAQELGDAEDKVLSQKAAKEGFDKISEEIENNNKDLFWVLKQSGIDVNTRNTYNELSSTLLTMNRPYTLCTIPKNNSIISITAPQYEYVGEDKPIRIYVVGTNKVIIDKFTLAPNEQLPIYKKYDEDVTLWVHVAEYCGVKYQIRTETGYSTEARIATGTDEKNIGDTLSGTKLGYSICYNISVETMEIVKDNKYTGKKITFIGDSITWGYYDNGETTRSVNPYPQVIQEILGCVSVNLAVSGTSFATMLSGQVPNIPEDSDYVCVMAGINNRTKTELGEITDKEGDTWSALLYQLLIGIKEKVPNAKIIVLTPTSISNGGVLSGNFIKNVQQTILTAQYYGFTCIDVHGNCGFSYHIQSDRTKYYSDVLHLNDAGYKRLGEVISELLLMC